MSDVIELVSKSALDVVIFNKELPIPIAGLKTNIQPG